EPVDKPQHIATHRVERCASCDADLTEVADSKLDKRQVFDLPRVMLEVTEHQVEVKTCPACGQVNAAVFPEGVTQPTQYGPRIRAQMVYLNLYHAIPLARTAEIISELYQQSISDGTVFAAGVELAQRVEGVMAQIKAHLVETDEAVHFDET